MDAEMGPREYIASIEASVDALENALPDNNFRLIRDNIENINSSISKLQKYLGEELKSASDIYGYLNKNHKSLPDYINKLNAILTASRILSKNTIKFSEISKMTKQVNIFTTMESMIPNIKTQVMALKTTTDGFVRIKTRKNVNGNVTTTISTNNQTTPTGEVVIKVNETYFDKPKPPSPTKLDKVAQKSFNRFRAKLAQKDDNNAHEIVNQYQQQRLQQQRLQQQRLQQTTGGKRSRHRRTRRNCKTRRVTKHRRSHRGTRRV